MDGPDFPTRIVGETLELFHGSLKEEFHVYYQAKRAFRVGPVLLTMLSLACVFALVLTPGCSWFSKNEPQAKRQTKGREVSTCPLCGREISDNSQVDRRPVAIKVENDPAARPQSGLDKSCIVYEEITEGGITRFMAVYLCREADPVGPVRSARPVDIDLVYPFDALFAHCGGGKPTLDMIKRSSVCDLDELAYSDAYWRWKGRRAPHNLYTSTSLIRGAGDPVYPFQGEVFPAFAFMTSEEIQNMKDEYASERQRLAENQQAGTATQTTYEPLVTLAGGFNVPYTASCAVRYEYNFDTQRFARYVSNLPHTDFTTGDHLGVDTVIVQYVTESRSGIKDVRGAESPNLGVIGSGRAQIFMLGQMIDGNWEKVSREDQTRYFDNSGDELSIKPGNIWIELVPSSKEVSID